MKNKMDPSNREKEDFLKLKESVSMLLRIRGTLAGKDITISIAPTENSNYASVECAT
jgi:hypothetical protein